MGNEREREHERHKISSMMELNDFAGKGVSLLQNLWKTTYHSYGNYDECSKRQPQTHHGTL